MNTINVYTIYVKLYIGVHIDGEYVLLSSYFSLAILASQINF